MSAGNDHLAARIKLLRARLGLTQANFGRLAGLDAQLMTVARWESGALRPGAARLIALGKLAGPPECWYFWGLVGLTRADVQQALALPESRHS